MSPLTSISQICIWNHHQQVLGVVCDKVWLWCGIITLHCAVTEVGLFWHMVYEGEIWRETDPTSMLTGRSRIFWHKKLTCWSIKAFKIHLKQVVQLTNFASRAATKNGPFLTKLLWKVVHFLRQIQQNWLNMQSGCVSDNSSPCFNKWATYIRHFPQIGYNSLAGGLNPNPT